MSRMRPGHTQWRAVSGFPSLNRTRASAWGTRNQGRRLPIPYLLLPLLPGPLLLAVVRIPSLSRPTRFPTSTCRSFRPTTVLRVRLVAHGPACLGGGGFRSSPWGGRPRLACPTAVASSSHLDGNERSKGGSADPRRPGTMPWWLHFAAPSAILESATRPSSRRASKLTGCCVRSAAITCYARQ